MIIETTMDHLAEIVKIEQLVFNKPWTKLQLEQDIDTQLETKNYVYIFREKVVGYIFGWIIQDEYHLNNIAVHAKHQQKNIGKSLIQHVISGLIPKKVKVILLEVSKKNKAARNCYESLGFILKGNRKDYYGLGDDAYLYNLEIGAND